MPPFWLLPCWYSRLPYPTSPKRHLQSDCSSGKLATQWPCHPSPIYRQTGLGCQGILGRHAVDLPAGGRKWRACIRTVHDGDAHHTMHMAPLRNRCKKGSGQKCCSHSLPIPLYLFYASCSVRGTLGTSRGPFPRPWSPPPTHPRFSMDSYFCSTVFPSCRTRPCPCLRPLGCHPFPVARPKRPLHCSLYLY